MTLNLLYLTMTLNLLYLTMTLNLLYLTMTLNLKRKMSHFINEFKQNRNSVDIFTSPVIQNIKSM
jgi:hypothetical protein